MAKRDEINKEDKRKMEEYKRNPMINWADSVNRSMIGDLAGLAKGSRLSKIITTLAIIGMLFFLSQCSN